MRSNKMGGMHGGKGSGAAKKATTQKGRTSGKKPAAARGRQTGRVGDAMSLMPDSPIERAMMGGNRKGIR